MSKTDWSKLDHLRGDQETTEQIEPTVIIHFHVSSEHIERIYSQNQNKTQKKKKINTNHKQERYVFRDRTIGWWFTVSHSLSICLWLINGNSNSPGSQAYTCIESTSHSIHSITNVNVVLSFYCFNISFSFSWFRSISLTLSLTLCLSLSLYFVEIDVFMSLWILEHYCEHTLA